MIKQILSLLLTFSFSYANLHLKENLQITQQPNLYLNNIKYINYECKKQEENEKLLIILIMTIAFLLIDCANKRVDFVVFIPTECQTMKDSLIRLS